MEVVNAGHLKGEVDVGVAVAEPGHVLHLSLIELQESVAVGVLHVHDVKHRLDVLQAQHST